MPELIYPPKPKPGAAVAVVSPSAGLPGRYPEVYETGLARLRDLGLEPVEYPTTRTMGADPRERARDLQAAFADPDIAAVLTSIGGDDQITVLPHLDRDVLQASPKPFFGYSDNTTLLHLLYDCGIVGYHGGSIMVNLGRGGGPHPVHLESLRAALFTDGWYELFPADEFSDESGDWADPVARTTAPPMQQGEGWIWHGRTDRVVEGALWGGNLEVLSWLLMAGHVGPNARYAGCVFAMETSEQMPAADEVYYILRSMGERGLLAGFPAVLVGRAKAWDISRPNPPEVRAAYVAEQRAAVGRALAEYAPDAVVVYDLDIGHTDPQQILPYGGQVRVDATARRIAVRY
jgi:muramoyltetrapeptide carboxypeptidase LdcA involved in peptidoglycan recycling